MENEHDEAIEAIVGACRELVTDAFAILAEIRDTLKSHNDRIRAIESIQSGDRQ